MRDLVNAKVDPKRIEQIDFILKYFSVVKCLKNHVKIDFFRWWYFERFSRFVGESPHAFGVHAEEFNDLVEEGLFVPRDFPVFPRSGVHSAHEGFTVLGIDRRHPFRI